jgi:hypothetical protein
MRTDVYWNLRMRAALWEACSLHLMLVRKVTRDQGPTKAVGTPEDAAAAYDMDNTRVDISQEQDRLVWAKTMEAA